MHLVAHIYVFIMASRQVCLVVAKNNNMVATIQVDQLSPNGRIQWSLNQPIGGLKIQSPNRSIYWPLDQPIGSFQILRFGGRQIILLLGHKIGMMLKNWKKTSHEIIIECCCCAYIYLFQVFYLPIFDFLLHPYYLFLKVLFNSKFVYFAFFLFG